MSSSSENAWSNNPNAPQVSYNVYFYEKCDLAGDLLAAVFYGITVTLFFQCMGALLNPVDRKTRGTKWGLVAHTIVLFSALTVICAMNFIAESDSYIDNRKFPGLNDLSASGPTGYENLINDKGFYFVTSVTALVSPCLGDAFFIYRCYVIYSMNYWVIVLPCLMYLATLAVGIAAIYYQNPSMVPWNSFANYSGVSFYSISLSLNVLLTLMIATRLILHRRNIRNAIGPATDSGLYNTLIAIIVESCLLYAVASLLYLGPLGANDRIQGVFVPILANAQVISPFLITLRVANRTALTSDAVSSGKIGSIRFRSRGGSTAGNEILSGEDLMSPMETDGGASGEPGTVVEYIIEEVTI